MLWHSFYFVDFFKARLLQSWLSEMVTRPQTARNHDYLRSSVLRAHNTVELRNRARIKERQSGAIIEDPKSCDTRARMIWDNFWTFWPDCATLTKKSQPIHAHLVGSLCVLSCYGIKWWELRDSLADSQRWQKIWKGIRTRALICSSMLWVNAKGTWVFQGRKEDYNTPQWMNK